MPYAPSITAKAGYKLVLQVADNLSPTVFATVGGIRTPRLAINNNPADITNSASQGFRELLPDGGIQSMTLSGDGVYDSKTAGAFQKLFKAAVNRTYIEARIVSGHGDSFIGTFVPATCERTGPFDGAEGFSITLESSGKILYVPIA